MPIDEDSISNESHDLTVTLTRLEGKLDRMSDKIDLTESRVEALLDVVTGSRSGAAHGLIVRVRDLEQQMIRIEVTLNEINGINDRMDVIESKLDSVLEMQVNHPSLIYMLRFQTRRTVMWLIIAFILLSLWWVSGWRQPILEFFGIPAF